MLNRPLEFYEAIHVDNCIGIAAFLVVQLTKAQIERAWYFTELRHPYLRMELQIDDSLPMKLRFQEKIPLQSIPTNQFVSEIGPLTEEGWKSILQEMTSQPRSKFPELWYIRLRSNPEQTQHQLFFMINHCGSDGVGVFAIVATFFDFLEKILANEQLSEVQSLEFLNIQAQLPPNFMEIPSYQSKKTALPALKHQSTNDPNDPAVVSAIWFEFDEEKTKKLIDVCKRHNVTIQAAVSCAEMLGVAINYLSNTNLPHHMLIWAPVNIRPYVIPPISNEHSVNGSSTIIWEQDLRSDISLWQLLQDTTEAIKNALASQYPLKFRYDVQFFPELLNKTNPFTFMASSVGKCPIRSEYRGFKLHGVKLIAGAYDACRVSSAGMLAHAYTVQDRFTITFGYTNPSFSPQWAMNFCKIMEKFLTELSSDKDEKQTVGEFIQKITNQ